MVWKKNPQNLIPIVMEVASGKKEKMDPMNLICIAGKFYKIPDFCTNRYN